MSNTPDIYLASKSPRRRELLEQIGLSYEVVEGEIDETPVPNETPEVYVERLAIAKSRAGYNSVMSKSGVVSAPVLGSDTTVTIDGEVLGKPRTAEHAREMLERLSGRQHHVLTAIALTVAPTRVRSAVSSTSVQFRPLQTQEIDAYWATGEPADKAGAYAIQGKASVFVTRINGSYSGVVGLPLYELHHLLNTDESQPLRRPPNP